MRTNGRNRCSICGALGVNKATHEDGMTRDEHEAASQPKIHRPSVAGMGLHWGSLTPWTPVVAVEEEPIVLDLVEPDIEDRLASIEAWMSVISGDIEDFRIDVGTVSDAMVAMLWRLSNHLGLRNQ